MTTNAKILDLAVVAATSKSEQVTDTLNALNGNLDNLPSVAEFDSALRSAGVKIAKSTYVRLIFLMGLTSEQKTTFMIRVLELTDDPDKWSNMVWKLAGACQLTGLELMKGLTA